MTIMASSRGVLISRRFADRLAALTDASERQKAAPAVAQIDRRAVDVPLRVLTEYDNCLACRVWDLDEDEAVTPPTTDEPDAGIVYVAKPYKLQRVSYDALTINGISYTYTSINTRTATDGEDSENHAITPSYDTAEGPVLARTYEGDLIWARTCTTGLTDPADEPIYLRDLNEDGRAWAKTDDD